jgi:hypothetical protein
MFNPCGFEALIRKFIINHTKKTPSIYIFASNSSVILFLEGRKHTQFINNRNIKIPPPTLYNKLTI